MKTSYTILLFLVFISCGKKGPEADPTSIITDRWWCDKSGFTLSQFFKSDGTWQQKSPDGSLLGSGKWKLSSNKKTIEIYDVLDDAQVLDGWEYRIEKAEEDNLVIVFVYYNLTMDMEPCP